MDLGQKLSFASELPVEALGSVRDAVEVIFKHAEAWKELQAIGRKIISLRNTDHWHIIRDLAAAVIVKRLVESLWGKQQMDSHQAVDDAVKAMSDLDPDFGKFAVAMNDRCIKFLPLDDSEQVVLPPKDSYMDGLFLGSERECDLSCDKVISMEVGDLGDMLEYALAGTDSRCYILRAKNEIIAKQDREIADLKDRLASAGLI